MRTEQRRSTMPARLRATRPLAWAAALLSSATLLVQPAATAGTVSISGQLTSFQSPLDLSTPGGDGTLNGVPLAIDPNAPPVRYPQDVPPNANAWPQSFEVALAPGTQQVQFEYTSFIGTANANPNRLSFTPAADAVVSVGQTFKIGTISYTNGFWYPAATVGISITTQSTDPTLNGKTFTGKVNVVTTNYNISVTDPVLNADFFYLSDASGPLTSLGSVRVYEKTIQPAGNPGNVGSVDLFARIGSLIPTGFANPSGGAFLSPSIVPLSPVPEPSQASLLLAGLALCGIALRRGGKRQDRE